ncbi:thioesterase superfamily [Hyaloraphidium curvatum]|nr:thioesterase superfamily [Hyaloraphidium curvatum]
MLPMMRPRGLARPLARLDLISDHCRAPRATPRIAAPLTTAAKAHGGLSPSDRAFYKFWLDIQTRWMDNDQYGHVNNAVYYSYFDTVVNVYLIRHCGLNPTEPPADDGAIGLVVSSNCTYKDSLEYPDVAETGLSVVKLGNSSVTYQIGVFSRAKSIFAATGQFVHVFVDPKTRRPTPIPDELRKGMSALLV